MTTGIKFLLIISLLIVCLSGCGNAKKPDGVVEREPEAAETAGTEEATETDIADNIEVFTQSSIRIRADIGTIYIDPFQMNEEPHDADFILITHEHYDHYSPEDIGKVAGDSTVFVIPENMKKKVGEVSELMKKTETVKPGSSYEIDGLEFETVPAYNIIKPYHPKLSAWVGYVLKLGGKRIYIAGDTDATKEARAVSCDIALVPIGGTYTMDAVKGAELVNELSPELAIPTHYGSIVGSKEDEDVFAENVKEPVKTEFKIPF